MAENGARAALPDAFNDWVARQRWFPGPARSVRLASVGSWSFPVETPGVSIRTHLVVDRAAAGPHPTVYQLPVTERTTELAGRGDALITTITAADGSPRFVYDAPFDPRYAEALLGLILDRGQSRPDDDDRAHADGEVLTDGEVGQVHAGRTRPSPPARAEAVVSSRVLSGEQSNTSIIFELADATGRALPPVICKIFRAVQDGANPDVTVQAALARAGSRFVPTPIGCVSGEWDDPTTPDGRARGHLAFAQEFLPDVEDAWRVVLRAAFTGEDFTVRARSLGVATADVHADLADAMPTVTPTPAMIDAALDEMRARARQAIELLPALAVYGPAIDVVFDAAGAAPWPRLQRIHGDYHLGQVLDVPGRGWVLVDFEGEPLRPLSERTEPDVPWRDVAGMIRSFSYAAGTVSLDDEARTASATAWAAACRRAFLSGYSERSGRSLAEQGPLLAAFELDKALYEAGYESRNRPDWLPIPVAAITGLLTPIAGVPASLAPTDA